MGAKTPGKQEAAQPPVAAVELTSGSVEETQALGERIGRALQPGDAVAFYGELGSGKTTCIQGIAQGLGCDPRAVKSPTFVLIREYHGRVPVIHIDGYRLEGTPAVAWLDVDLIFSPHKVTLIEWAERCEGLLPESYLEVRLTHVSTNRRRCTVIPVGARARALAEAIRPTKETNETPGD